MNNANPYYQDNPYSLSEPFREASRSIEACVIVGGAIFEDGKAYRELLKAGTRGLTVRILFPHPHSRWLGEFASEARIDPAVYSTRIRQHAKAVTTNVDRVELRWYDAPAPCWFVLIDGCRLYTKPIDTHRVTFPVLDTRGVAASHFAELFTQLWALSRFDIQEPSRPDKAPIVSLVQAPQELLKVLAAHPEALNSLTPEAFESFVADRLSAMHLAVKRIGHANQKDGGIDLIAWPAGNASFPFLLAVQIKHSRLGRPVGPGPIRELVGVLGSQPLDAGVVITNTSFTPDARWAATQSPRMIRLRDFRDLVRWIRADFANETYYDELPHELLLAPGIRVDIPRMP